MQIGLLLAVIPDRQNGECREMPNSKEINLDYQRFNSTISSVAKPASDGSTFTARGWRRGSGRFRTRRTGSRGPSTTTPSSMGTSGGTPSSWRRRPSGTTRGRRRRKLRATAGEGWQRETVRYGPNSESVAEEVTQRGISSLTGRRVSMGGRRGP